MNRFFFIFFLVFFVIFLSYKLLTHIIRFNRNAEHADLTDSRGFFIFAKSKIRYEPLLFYFFLGVLCNFP